MSGYFKVDRKNSQKINFILTDLKYSPFQDQVVGTLEYDYFEDSKKLLITWVHVDQNLNELGISTQLIQEVLMTNPETEFVAGYLTDTNDSVYKEKLKKGFSDINALKATPFFKSFAQFGFSSLVSLSLHEGRAVILLRKNK